MTKWKHGCARGLSAAAIFVVVAFLPTMPHLHSLAARERRKLRAIERSFLVPSAGKAWIQADKQVIKAASASAESLSLHRIHDKLCQTVRHHGRLATLQAAMDGHLSAIPAKDTAEIHRTADRLKHTVSGKQPRVAPIRQPVFAPGLRADIVDDDRNNFDFWEELVDDSSPMSSPVVSLPCVEKVAAGLNREAAEFLPQTPFATRPSPAMPLPFGMQRDGLLCDLVGKLSSLDARLQALEHQEDKTSTNADEGDSAPACAGLGSCCLVLGLSRPKWLHWSRERGMTRKLPFKKLIRCQGPLCLVSPWTAQIS